MSSEKKKIYLSCGKIPKDIMTEGWTLDTTLVGRKSTFVVDGTTIREGCDCLQLAIAAEFELVAFRMMICRGACCSIKVTASVGPRVLG